jgi:hypothetical protein
VLPATQVHHAAGREGGLLLDQTLWRALCWQCHDYFTKHKAEAIVRGISVPRSTKR